MSDVLTWTVLSLAGRVRPREIAHRVSVRMISGKRC